MPILSFCTQIKYQSLPWDFIWVVKQIFRSPKSRFYLVRKSSAIIPIKHMDDALEIALSEKVTTPPPRPRKRKDEEGGEQITSISLEIAMALPLVLRLYQAGEGFALYSYYLAFSK